MSYIIECDNENSSMLYKNIINYDNVNELKIFSRTYIKFFNINIPIKEKQIFSCNTKSKK